MDESFKNNDDNRAVLDDSVEMSASPLNSQSNTETFSQESQSNSPVNNNNDSTNAVSPEPTFTLPDPTSSAINVEVGSE